MPFIPDPTPSSGFTADPGAVSPIERPPPQDPVSTTVPSSGIADWLQEQLQGFSLPKNTGGLVGGLALPLALTAAFPAAGVPALVTAGFTGGVSGQMLDNLLRGKSTLSDPLNTAAQGIIGGAGGGMTLPLEGAGLAAQGAMRNLGAASDIAGPALASKAAVPMQGVQAFVNDLAQTTRLGTPARSVASDAQAVADFLAPHIQSPAIPIRDFMGIRDILGSMARQGNTVAARAYGELSNILRTQAGPEGQAIAQSIGEQQALKAVTPDFSNLGSMGLSRLLSVPLTAGPQALYGLGKEASYLGGQAFNPYIATPMNLGLESVWNRFGGGGTLRGPQ